MAEAKTAAEMAMIEKEYTHQKMADQVKLMMREVERLANLADYLVRSISRDRIISAIQPGNDIPGIDFTSPYQAALEAERELQRIPYLRRVNLRDNDPSLGYRYIIDIGIPPSPAEEDAKDKIIHYLEELAASKYGMPIGRFRF